MFQTQPNRRIQRLVVRDDPIADHVDHCLHIHAVAQTPPLVSEERGHRGSLRPRPTRRAIVHRTAVVRSGIISTVTVSRSKQGAMIAAVNASGNR